MNLLGHVDRQQSVAVKIDRVLFGASQYHFAEFGLDDPLIRNGWRDERGETAFGDCERALVDDLRPRLRRLIHNERTAGNEFPGVFCTDAGCGHHQSSGIDL